MTTHAAVEKTYRRAGTYRVEFPQDGRMICTRDGKAVEFERMPKTMRERALCTASWFNCTP